MPCENLVKLRSGFARSPCFPAFYRFLVMVENQKRAHLGFLSGVVGGGGVGGGLARWRGGWRRGVGGQARPSAAGSRNARVGPHAGVASGTPYGGRDPLSRRIKRT